MLKCALLVEAMMNLFKTILVPVDLSEFNRNSIAVATNLARANHAKLIFCYVALPTLPTDALYAQQEFEALLERERTHFNEIQPSDASVEFDRVFIQGNPGPDIIRVAERRGCDLIVLASHGRTGLLRWLMGSVAEYVTRHAKCPVLTLRMPAKSSWFDATAGRQEALVAAGIPSNESGENDDQPERQRFRTDFVTAVMQHSAPIHGYDSMEEVATELEAVSATAAPVIDEMHQCIGILTTSDITGFRKLQCRLTAQDESVLDEVFPTDEFGMRRTNDDTFKRVQRHMTAPVVTVDAMATCDEARKLLANRPDIHHLVVVDEASHPLGVIDAARL